MIPDDKVEQVGGFFLNSGIKVYNIEGLLKRTDKTNPHIIING